MLAKWLKWTFLESLTRTTSKLLQKVIGGVSVGIAHTFFATTVIGFIQIIVGFVVAKVRKEKLITNRTNIIGSCFFGLFATVGTVLPFIVFYLGGDIGINTFIATLSIVPGALIDRFVFKNRLGYRKWLGILIAVLGGYVILELPSLKELILLPLWVWLSFAMMFSGAINQGITQKIKTVDPFVKNFWGGLVTFSIALIGLAILNSTDLLFNFNSPMPKLWLSSIVIGVIVIALWTFNLISYKAGAQIAIKRLVMSGAYLIMVMILGVLLFGESLTMYKVSGILLFLVAFIFMDDESWHFFKMKLKLN